MLLRQALEALRDIGRSDNAEAYPGIEAVMAELRDILDAIAGTHAAGAHSADPSKVGRIVTDAWPMSSPVTDVVLDAIQAYGKLR